MPQPIDPFTEMGRLSAAERMQQAADRASLAAQLRQATEAENQRSAAESQVRQSQQKSEEVEQELRRRNPFMGRRRRKVDGENEPEQAFIYNGHERRTVVSDAEEHDFDVTI